MREFAPPVQALLEMFRSGWTTPVTVDDVPQMRRDYDAILRDRAVAGGVTVSDVVAGGVPVRLYRPDLGGPLPLHVYCHGGGFVVGSAVSGQFDGVLSRRAAAARCVVASVEYRKAPEHPFPAGVEDAYSALVGLVGRAAELDVATRAVSVGGMSSGGNFAAVIALMVRDRGGPALILQLLEIAGLDLTKSSVAWRNPGPGADTTRERDLARIDHYLASVADRARPYASPLFAADLSGLAPAYVMNAEHDPRRDECETYVTRLRDAGVHAVASTQPGHVHGSHSITGWEPAMRWQAEADAVLAEVNVAAMDDLASSALKL